MRRAGYTLIELLVVIAIIGLLATLGTYAWNSSGQRSRDSVRKSDLSRISNALQQFYQDNRTYPEFDETKGGGNVFAAGYQLSNSPNCAHKPEKTDFVKYLTTVPQDPKRSENFKDMDCADFNNFSQENLYLYLAANTRGDKDTLSPRYFALLATLERDKDRIPLGENPVLTSIDSSKFKNYYASDNNITNFNPNYMVTGSNGK